MKIICAALGSAVTWIAVGLLIGLPCARPGVARAQEAPKPGAEPPEYGGLVDEAVEEYGLGHYMEARVLFQRAHDAFPNARTLRGLGMAEFELRNYVESAALLDHALVARARPLQTTLRLETSQLLDRARHYIGRFAITLRPTGAQLTIDHKPPRFDAHGSALMTIGDHALQASAPGYDTATRTLHVQGGEDQKLEIALVAQAAATQTATASATTAATTATTTPQAPTTKRRRSFFASPWLWIGVGVAVVAVVSVAAATDSF